MKDFKRPLIDDEILHWISIIAVDGILVRSELKLEIIKDDPDDDKFIEAAVTGKADYLVTQDNHLLKIKKFREINILTPQEFLSILGNQ